MGESHIVSWVEGRIRARHPALQRQEEADRISALLQQQPGIAAIRINRRTGSLLLEYDPARLAPDALAALWMTAVETEAAPAPQATPPIQNRRLAAHCLHRGMLVTLIASAAFGLLGRTRAHILTGSLFLAGTLIHLYRVRKTL